MLTPPTLSDLAAFSGRAEGSYSAFSTSSLAQATVLFEVLTGLTEWPSDSTKLQLAKYGVLEMADFIYLKQPYQQQAASPVSSETIGSYSYSKVIQAAKKGQETGLFWFDLAVKRLKTTQESDVKTGAIVMDEWEGVKRLPDGRSWVPGPKGEGYYTRIEDPSQIFIDLDPWS